MSDIFISYSRKDIAFARLLYSTLEKMNFDSWIDWERIPIGENWWLEIEQAIQNSTIFMFIISKNSIGSYVCKDEINIALKNKKRIIPVVIDNLPEKTIKEFVPDLSKINWAIFTKDDHFYTNENDLIDDTQLTAERKDPQFTQAIEKLNETIKKDWDWVKFHTQLQVDAQKWQNNNKNKSYLLHGSELKQAIEKISKNSAIEPTQTQLQIDYIKSSTISVKNRKRNLSIIIVGVLVIIGIIASVGYFQKKIADFRHVITKVNNTMETNPADALLLGVEAQNFSNIFGTKQQEHNYSYEAQSTLLSVFQTNNNILKILPGEDDVQNIGIDIRSDDNLMATSDQNGNITLWNLMNSNSPVALENKITGHAGNIVASIKFNQRGDLLVSAGFDGAIMVWNLSDPYDPQLVGKTEMAEDNSIFMMKFIPATNIAVTVDSQGIFSFWNISSFFSPTLISNYQDEGSVYGFDITPDGKNLIYGSMPTQIKILDITDYYAPTLITTIETEKDVFDISVNYSGQLYAAGYINGNVEIWDYSDITTPILLSSFQAHENAIQSLKFSPNKNILISASRDNTIKIWDINNPEIPQQSGDTLFGHNNYVNFIDYFSNGLMMASTGRDGRTIIWDLDTSTTKNLTLATLPDHIGQVKTITSNYDNSLLVTGSSDIKLWDLTDIKSPIFISELSYDYLASTTAKFNLQEDILAIAITDLSTYNKIILWDLSDPYDPKMIGEPFGNFSDRIYALSFSSDGKTLFAGSWDKTIEIWDLTNIETPSFFENSKISHKDQVYSMLLVEKTNSLIVGGSEGNLYFWNIENPSNIKEYIPSIKTSGVVFNLSYSPEKDIMASSALDKIILWDISKKDSPQQINELQSLLVNGSPKLSINNEGTLLAMGANEGAFIIWDIYDIENPQLIGNSIQAHNGNIWAVDFLENTDILITGGLDAKAIIWGIGPESLITKACDIYPNSFSKEEWEFYFDNLKFNQTCPNQISNSLPIPLIQNQTRAWTLEEMANADFSQLNLLDEYIEDIDVTLNDTASEITYLYNVVLDKDQPLLWTPNWCASNEEILEQNLLSIKFEEYIDNKIVSNENFFDTYMEMGDQYCYMRVLIISDLNEGTIIESKILIDQDINDGFEDKSAGIENNRYTVSYK